MLENWSRKVPSSMWVEKLAGALESNIIDRPDLAKDVRQVKKYV